jgi:hypothetical protein
MVVVVVVLLVLLLFLVWVGLERRSGSDVESAGGPVAVVPTVGGSGAGLDVSVGWEASVEAWRGRSMGDVVLEEVVPGLHRCASRVEGVALEALHGIGTAFPRSLEGAVAAAANSVVFFASPAFYIDAQRRVLQPLVFMPDSWWSEEQAAGWQARMRLDGSGRPLDADGRVLDSVVSAAGAYPRYGAYKVHHADYDGAGLLQEVFLSWWMPSVAGSGTVDDMSGAVVSWVVWSFEAVWTRADRGWRVELAYDVSTPPPADPSHTNQSFAARRAVLGEGWCVPADATEGRLPGAVLTR